VTPHINHRLFGAPPLNAEECTRMRELHGQGKSVAEIMRATGRSKGSVWRALNGKRTGGSTPIHSPKVPTRLPRWKLELAQVKGLYTRRGGGGYMSRHEDDEDKQQRVVPITLYRLSIERDEHAADERGS
jgi:hypothetical protein